MKASDNFLSSESVAGIPIITVTGTPRTMGQKLGERLRPRITVLIQDVCEQLCRHHEPGLIDSSGGFNRSGGQELIESLVKPTQIFLAEHSPSLWSEIKAMATAAEVDPIYLLAVNAFNDLLDIHNSAEALFESNVISLAARQTEDNRALLGFDWNIPPYLIPHLTLVRRIPSNGPATLSLGLAGLHTIAGLNGAGVAISSNDLRFATGGTPAMSSTSLIHSALSTITWEESVHTIQQTACLGSRAFHLLNKDNQRISFEKSGAFTAVIPDTIEHAPRIHTNHRLVTNPIDNTAPLSKGLDLKQNNHPAVRHSQVRLKRLAGHVRKARACNPQIMNSWFESTHTENTSGRFRSKAFMEPVAACVAVLEPRSNTIWCHAGASPRDLENVSI